MYQDKIKEIDIGIQALRTKRAGILREWVEKHHPCSIGDRMIVNGYSFRGKNFIVTDRWVAKDWGENWRWYAAGNILKANGAQGKQVGEWSEVVSPEKLEIIKEK